MKSRPILFSSSMSLAIRREVNPKTQTRRIIKPQPPFCGDRAIPSPTVEGSWSFSASQSQKAALRNFPMRCPYGVPGDFLYVKEAWKTRAIFDDLKPVDIGNRVGKDVLYLSDNQFADLSGCREEFIPGRYRHARFMPYWASRTTLEITNVRVERLQDISEEDAIAEGIRVDECNHVIREDDINWGGAVSEYAALWSEINGKDSWSSNPWVWVVLFKKLERAA
jgi:hypothetical protein